ncbi:MAG: occludin [Bacteroides sp.]|nr:occludin [Bacteroides sp.]
MKGYILIAFFLSSVISVYAQSEATADSLRTQSPRDGVEPTGEMLLPETRNYDGFLLDMSLMNVNAPKLENYKLEVPNVSKDYSSIFRLNPNVTYSQGLSDMFSLSPSRFYSTNPFGLSGFWNTTDNLQMGSFRLKNGMRINTYGEYDKDGRKVHNPSALPWEKNNFKGAFELKSANGSFGIRIEVQQGNRSPF